MALRHIETAPTTDEFTPIQQHQEQTPSTFFDSKPVLYAHYDGLTLSAPASQFQQDVAFSKFTSEGDGEDALVKDIAVWVSSESLIFFQNSPSPTGVSIPYPAVALHATMKFKSTVEALYMNLSLNDAETVNDEEEIQMLELTVLPPSYSSSPDTACIKDIFGAMNICADLHPDPNASDDDDGEDLLDDSAPGANGWITADNMDEYIDEDGNFRGMVIGDELGPGAGTVRSRDDDEGTNGMNDVHGHGEKYHRTG
ncbi:hypothetical protein EJ02DRAFT_356170 [Clathrospora elynae]|uniref:Regulator of volume decrease after cellular swelling-domain-containing protein n=1 Tax=Clathrospora elynae TaxID=706981 RepID=A0A6A5SK72_9PLEO|nr:hypothetical protein EJ02DRAFT_356170 [Clathrospora elynae]